MVASKVVGLGPKGTIAGLEITFDRPISGDGLFTFTTSNFLLNTSTGTSFALTGFTRDSSDRNKITAVTVSATTGWSTGNFFVLMIDSGTTTFSTIAAAVAAASATDFVIVYPVASNGDRRHRITSEIIIAADIIVETDAIGEKNFITVYSSDPAFRLDTACTVRDFVIFGPASFALIEIQHTSGLVTIERVIGNGSDNGAAFDRLTTSTANIRFKNCRAVAAALDGWRIRGTGGTVDIENCAALYCNRDGYSNGGTGVTVTCTNCVALLNLDNFSGTITGDNNASSNIDIPTGTGNLTSQTFDQFRPAFGFIEGDPTDWRFLDGGNSSLENAGKVIAGLTLDEDGRTRSATTPNIGPTEGFIQFGVAAAVGRQARARMHNV